MEPSYAVVRAILKPWLAAWFRWHIEGLANIPRQGPLIFAFNHIAYLDPFAAAYVLDRVGRIPRFLAKAELFDDKRIAWILRSIGQIPVKRGSATAPMALDAAFDALNRNQSVVIFPEGTITNDPDLYPMQAKTGLARLALGSGVPVVPVALWGTANIWPKGYAKRWKPRQDICASVGEPMVLSGDAESTEDWERVMREVMDRIGVLLARLRPAVPDRRRPRKKAA